MTSTAIATTKLAKDKRGNPRIWIEGRKLEQAGFKPQARYRMTIDTDNRRIVLALAKDGDRTVSRRARRGKEMPIVDIVNASALGSFLPASTLRIDFAAGTIVIEPSANDARRIRREARTLSRLKEDRPLRCGSVSTGLGVLSHALHEGLAQAGIRSELAFSVEIDQEYQDLCAERNPAWHPTTQSINMPLQEFAFDKQAIDKLEEIDILEAGIPCTAHSIAGRSKKKLTMPEHDPVAGHLVVGFLAIVAACNPSVVIVENVPQYAESASFAILTNQLTEWGYDIDTAILKGEDFECLEHRHRMALVATSRSMNAQVHKAIHTCANVQLKVGDVLEDIADDSPLWSEMKYLKDKEERDRIAGKGFRMQILGPNDTKVGTIGRGYAKVRSTEPKLKHPTSDTLLRQFTPVEHARIKGVPEDMVSDLPMTTAHEMLGQSIVAGPFRALGLALGSELSGWKEGRNKAKETGVAEAPKVTAMPDQPMQLGLL